MVDADDNGKFRLERVKEIYHRPNVFCDLVAYSGWPTQSDNMCLYTSLILRSVVYTAIHT